MSLVVFPFKSEPATLVARNMAVAADVEEVDEVWAVAAEEGDLAAEVGRAAREVAAARAKPIEVIVQERIGRLRPGKGDAMNTAIGRAAEQGRERVHFYDADISNFDRSWIEGAERAADRGFGVVRHRFPRAATDAMITWMITRPALARLFPGTILPRLGQPLGGEVLLTLPALEALASSDRVRQRSDWGIDTVLTHASTLLGLGVYEHHVDDGKRHTLYGSLDELREMVLECLDAASSLAGEPGPAPDTRHEADPPGPVPGDLKEVVAYDLSESIRLLSRPWSAAELELASDLPPEVVLPLTEGSPPSFDHMDADVWYGVHGFLLEQFRLGDPAWEDLAFRLWLARVLCYTTTQVPQGFDQATAYLESTIVEYERRAGAPVDAR